MSLFCNQASQGEGVKCTTMECQSNMNPTTFSFELGRCPVNNAGRIVCVEVVDGPNSYYCFGSQSYGTLDQPTEIWTRDGCGGNFSLCYTPAQKFDLGNPQSAVATRPAATIGETNPSSTIGGTNPSAVTDGNNINGSSSNNNPRANVNGFGLTNDRLATGTRTAQETMTTDRVGLMFNHPSTQEVPFTTQPVGNFPFLNTNPLTIPFTTERPSVTTRTSTGNTRANNLPTPSTPVMKTVKTPIVTTETDSLSGRHVDSSAAIIGGIIGGAVILVLLLILILVCLRRRRSKKNGNSSGIEWEDYTAKSRSQNGQGNPENGTLQLRSVPNGNEKPMANGTQNQGGVNNAGFQENSNRDNGTIQGDPKIQGRDKNEGFSV